jgi:hypothetical protein
MGFVAVLVCGGLGKSETDCLGELDGKWEIEGDVVRDGRSFRAGANGLIRYVSKRNRKKWQMNVCGELGDSVLVWSNVTVRVSRVEETNVGVVIQCRERVISKERISVEAGARELCVTVISGRGFMGVFLGPNKEKQEVVGIHELSIPRESSFEYQWLSPGNISRLCIGDYLGVPRHDIQVDNVWPSRVRDFL